MSPIDKVSKGGSPTFLDTALANKVIDAINAIARARVSPDGMGKFAIADALVLDLSPLKENLGQLVESSSSFVNMQTQIDAIKSALQSPNINAVCNGDGTITITVSFNI